MGRYVQRRPDGVVWIVQATMGAGVEEYLEEGHPDLVAWDLAEARADKLNEAEGLFTRRLQSGVAHGGHTFQIDPASQQNISALAVRALAAQAGAAAWPEGFVFIAADNAEVPFDAAAFLAFAQVAADRVIALRMAYRSRKNALLAAPDLAALAAIDLSAGWP
jgi:hypothetical protein